MRRKLIEDLLDDAENFHDKVVGTFVRIRISGGNQKQDLYRLAQVVGTSKATECYKVGKKTTCCMLEILNLNKTEFISIDSVSNQEFTEEECSRLRQSIKCGLISRLTVGDVLEKSMEIQIARVNDERHWSSPALAAALQVVSNTPQTDRLKEALRIAPRLLDSYFGLVVHEANDWIIHRPLKMLQRVFALMHQKK